MHRSCGFKFRKSMIMLSVKFLSQMNSTDSVCGEHFTNQPFNETGPLFEINFNSFNGARMLKVVKFKSPKYNFSNTVKCCSTFAQSKVDFSISRFFNVFPQYLAISGQMRIFYSFRISFSIFASMH